MVTGWQNIEGKWYYFNKDGERLTGFQTIGKYKYCLTAKGVLRTGWFNVDGKTYHTGPNGRLYIGWRKADGNKYHFDSDGALDKGWYTSPKGYTYYITRKDGVKTGWQTIDGKKYYFFPANGIMKTGWTKQDGKYIFLKDKTWEADYTIDGEIPYPGSMAQNEDLRINGKTYKFDGNGYASEAVWKSYFICAVCEEEFDSEEALNIHRIMDATSPCYGATNSSVARIVDWAPVTSKPA